MKPYQSGLVALAWALSAADAFGEPAPTQEAIAAVETIVVTASPIPGDPDRFATIVTQVDRDDIVKSGGANLADALRDVPGVASTGFAAAASRPVIRGMDAFRVKVMEDGINASDVSEVGPDHGVPIDPLSAQNIEVVRGAATLRYGSQAIGGVVNALNNRVPLTLPDDSLSGEANASYSSNADVYQGAALLDGRAGQFAFHADASGRHADDYDIPDGTQGNSFVRGDTYSAGSSYFFGDNDASHVGLGIIRYDAKYGIPSDTTFIDMRQTKYLTKSSIHLGDGTLQSLNVDAGYADYVHDEDDPDGTVLATFKNKEWDGRAETLFGAMGPLSATAIGVQIGDRKFSAGGDASTFLSPTHTQTEAVFAFTEAPLGPRTHLQAAARVERVTVDGTPASDVQMSPDFTPVSGSLGVLYDVSDAVKLGLTLTSAARAPGQVELFARGPHDGPGTFETGDPNLDIERANSLEATLRVRQDRFQFEGALWGASFTNYIFGHLTGRTCDDDGTCFDDDTHELRELFYAQQDAHFWGVEGKGTYDLIRASAGTLQAVALADYVRAQFANSGGAVPRIQPYRIGGGVNWSSGPLDAGVFLVYAGEQDHVPAGDTTTPSFYSLDVQAGWRPFSSQKGFEIALVGHNLTDDTQRNSVALNREVVEMPGRDVRLVLRQSF